MRVPFDGWQPDMRFWAKRPAPSAGTWQPSDAYAPARLEFALRLGFSAG